MDFPIPCMTPHFSQELCLIDISLCCDSVSFDAVRPATMLDKFGHRVVLSALCSSHISANNLEFKQSQSRVALFLNRSINFLLSVGSAVTTLLIDTTAITTFTPI